MDNIQPCYQRAEEIGRQKRKFKASDDELMVAVLQLYGCAESALLYERRRRAEEHQKLAEELRVRGAVTQEEVTHGPAENVTKSFVAGRGGTLLKAAGMAELFATEERLDAEGKPLVPRNFNNKRAEKSIATEKTTSVPQSVIGAVPG